MIVNTNGKCAKKIHIWENEQMELFGAIVCVWIMSFWSATNTTHLFLNDVYQLQIKSNSKLKDAILIF